MTRDQEAILSKPGEVVVGWLCGQYNSPGNLFPEGVNGKGGSGGSVAGYDAWSGSRVESALSKYRDAYDKMRPGDGITMEKLMREWLRDQYWDSLGYESYGTMGVLVRAEVKRMLKMVKAEVDAFPLMMLRQVAQSGDAA
jgi:hypothetical protein